MKNSRRTIRHSRPERSKKPYMYIRYRKPGDIFISPDIPHQFVEPPQIGAVLEVRFYNYGIRTYLKLRVDEIRHLLIQPQGSPTSKCHHVNIAISCTLLERMTETSGWVEL